MIRFWMPVVVAAIALLPAARAADLMIGLAADVTTVDPHVLNASPNNSIAEQVFGTLVERDARQRLRPGLAESWRLINDTTWEFKLRRGVKFHDGSELTAEDVAFTIDRPATLGAMGGFTVFTRPIVANDEQVVQTVAQMLTRVGIAVKVEVMPFSVYIPRARKFDFSASLLGWGVTTGEAGYPLRSLVATINADKGNGTFNWSRYSNPKMDQLMEQALATVDNAKREQMLREATQIALRDQAVIPLFFQINTWAARKGYAYTPRTDERTYAYEVRAQ
jgi:ABC-type transport system substrate-binding protein